MWPATDDPADVGTTKLFDALWNGMYTEPMLLGRYPFDIAPLLEPSIQDGDMATIRQPARLLRRQLLQPAPGGGRRRELGEPLRVRRPGRLREDRLRLAGRARRAARVADHPAGPLPRRAAADHDHRVGLLLRHRPRRARRRRRPGPHRLSRRPPARGGHGDLQSASTSAATSPGR